MGLLVYRIVWITLLFYFIGEISRIKREWNFRRVGYNFDEIRVMPYESFDNLLTSRTFITNYKKKPY